MIYCCILLEIFTHSDEIDFYLRITAPFIIVIFIVLRYIVNYRTQIGTLLIDENNRFFIINGAHRSDITDKIAGFRNGGYYGQAKEFDFFLQGSYFRDGTKNILYITDKPNIRLFIRSSDQHSFLLTQLEKLEKEGRSINIENSFRMKMPI
jgi:hypothetical protein